MQEALFTPRDTAVARVALPVPVDSLFDYSLPPELSGTVPGTRVSVRFAGRPLTGVVVELVERSDAHPGSLASIDAALDDEAALSPSLMAAVLECAAQLLCPVGLALAAALPPGATPRVDRRIVLTPRGREAIRTGAARGPERELLEKIADAPIARALLARMQAGSERIRKLERDGLVRLESLPGPPAARARQVRTVRVADRVNVEQACASLLARSPGQAALLRQIERCKRLDTPKLRRQQPGSDALLRALAKRSLVVFEGRDAPRNVLGASVPRDEPAHLTPEQQAAFGTIAASIHARKDDTFLLHGVTGSGKTEVYLRAVAETLAAGLQALVLVPEITLTHQIVARLRMRFGDELAVLHSGLRPGERLEQWQRLRRGATPIAVGARSALFAPLERLGLIVIDEEHDTAYKNEEGFRYQACDLAARRARHASCPLLLGSATPSLESMHAAEIGRISRLVLPRRIGGRPLPAVEIVDLAKERERTPRGRKLILTRTLLRALRETLERGEQSILFLNRRGFATQIQCFDCGDVEQCPNCDVTLVYHATEQHLTCHYCDHTIVPPEVCRGCGAPDTALLGIGTERLEEEVRRAVPKAVIGRLDRDTARRRGHAESVLQGLRDGRIDVLIGTQMVAKGHDFPGVSLVGVVAADVGLHMPDFRAAERSFQLLTQVAGRAGRANTLGRVIVQTFSPEHYAIAAAREHDYERFYAQEMPRRAELAYPPYGRLARFVISGEELEATSEAARAVRDEIAKRSTAAGLDKVEVMGPAPAPLSRLRGRYRYQLLLKSLDEGGLLAAARLGLDACGRLSRGIQSTLDVAPVSML